jgi:CHAD domain-containing protein
VSATELEFELPEDLDEAALLDLLPRRLRVAVGRAQTADRVLLDSFDARLRAAGLRAEWPARRASTRRLTLLEPGLPPRSADVPDGPAVALAALPAGPLRDRLAPVLEERALLPLVRLRSRTVPVAVLNEDEKTVARLVLERPAVVNGRHSISLAARLRVESLRGYEPDFERTVRRLRDGLGLAPASGPLADAAVSAVGGRPEGVSSKVRVELAPGMRADVAAGLVLMRLADVAEANVPGAAEDLDPEFLHDLRVSIRRTRSVLRELDGVHAAGRRAKLRAELRWAQSLTGPVRDLDVQLLDWDALTGPVAEASGGQLEPLHELLVQRRARERVRLVRGLRSRRFAALLDAWRELAAGSDEGPRAALPIEVVAGDRIRAVYRRMVRDGRAIDARSPDTALHELRKRGKELRYLLELFGGLFPRPVVRPMLGALKDLQDVLGRFQDRAVQMEVLRTSAAEVAAQPGGPAALLSAGVLIAALQSDQHRARDEFAGRFEAFASREQRALVRDSFRKAGGS